jgi:hypothetical protein
MIKEFLKQIISRGPIYQLSQNLFRRRQAVRDARKCLLEYQEWLEKGASIPPPPAVKQEVLIRYAEEYRLRVLVETGTYYGDMVEATKDHFDKIYSIELSGELVEKAKKRFQLERHIEIIQGDSGEKLEHIMHEITRPALFWLDGHYSAGVTARGRNDTPIYEELTHILNAPDLGHVVVIDDARLFGTDAAYPTIEGLKEFVGSKRNNVQIIVEADSIRIIPAHYSCISP